MFVAEPLLFYECDTDKGSSGAPVIKEVNNQLELVAVHRANSFCDFNCGSLVSSILHHVTTGIVQQCGKCTP